MPLNTPTYIMRDDATYEYGSAAAGATTIQRAISGREVSSPHGDPAGHYSRERMPNPTAALAHSRLRKLPTTGYYPNAAAQ